MRGYGQFCPVAKACEIVAEWEMFLWQTRRGEDSFEGPRDLILALPGWLALSGYASVERPVRRPAGDSPSA